MNMIDKINKIDCDQIEELSHPIKDNFNLREDVVSKISTEKVFKKLQIKLKMDFTSYLKLLNK